MLRLYNIEFLMGPKTSIISVRVTTDVKDKLDIESEMNSTSLNTLISQILTKHVEWDRFAEDIGFVFLTKPFLRTLLDHIDEKTITTIAVSTCRGAMRDAIIYLKGEINIDTFLQAVDLWFGASHMPFRHIVKNGEDRYIVQHELGKKWSIYITSVMNSLLNEIGYHTKNQRLDDQSTSYEIVKT